MSGPAGASRPRAVAAAGRWLAAAAAAAGGVALLLALGGPALARAEAVPPLAGLRAFLLAGRVGLLAVGLAAIGLWPAWGSGRARAVLLAGALAGLLPAGARGWFFAEAGRYPAINDVTTTPDAPPAFREAACLPANAGRDLAYPGASVAATQRRAYPDLAPLDVPRPPAEVFAVVRRVAAAMPRWSVTAADPDARHLEAVAVTRLFRFRDDVVIEVRPAAAGAAVHVRSTSRVGRGDLGVNAARIRDFLARVREAARG